MPSCSSPAGPSTLPRLTNSEYGAGSVIAKLKETPLKVEYKDELHRAVSLRSFRAERVSELVKKVLDLEAASAKGALKAIGATLCKKGAFVKENGSVLIPGVPRD